MLLHWVFLVTHECQHCTPSVHQLMKLFFWQHMCLLALVVKSKCSSLFLFLLIYLHKLKKFNCSVCQELEYSCKGMEEIYLGVDVGLMVRNPVFSSHFYTFGIYYIRKKRVPFHFCEGIWALHKQRKMPLNKKKNRQKPLKNAFALLLFCHAACVNTVIGCTTYSIWSLNSLNKSMKNYNLSDCGY